MYYVYVYISTYLYTIYEKSISVYLAVCLCST